MDVEQTTVVARRVVAPWFPRLNAAGWTVTVRPDPPHGTSVELEHPLAPHTTFHVLVRQTEVDGAEFLTRCFTSFEPDLALVEAGGIRPSKQTLLGKLRAAAWQGAEHTTDALYSVGYALVEEDVLTEAEADWLAEALAHDHESRPQR